MSQANNQSNSNYFNLHLEGFANLYDVREVKPKAGQKWKPYVAVRAAFLQGQADSAEPVFVDLQVVGTGAKRIVEHFWNSINDRDQKVSAAVKAGDIRFKAGENDPKPGEERRVFVSARMLTVKYLQVKDANGQSKKYDEAALNVIAGKDSADAEQKSAPDQSNNLPTANQATNDVTRNMPDFIELDPDDENFEQRKAELKAAGYRWDRQRKGWSLQQQAA